jgi:hypothetical protein
MIGKLMGAAVLALALSGVPTALADGGPSPGVTEGGGGVLGASLRYVTVQGRTSTELVSIEPGTGIVRGYAIIDGGFGIPTVAYDGTTGGLSRDGATLVLAQTALYPCTPGSCGLARSTFAVYSAKTLRRRATVDLRGAFSFDALAPDGSRLYLIQYLPSSSQPEYKVRAYDLRRHVLVAGAIADRTQRGWVMRGSPMTRVTSVDGRFVYTLYEDQGGYPFVHALDTARGVAHCVGLPWNGDQTLVGELRMTLRDGGRTLALAIPAGRAPLASPSFAIDTRTWAVSQAPSWRSGQLPWWLLGLVFVPVAAAGVVLVRRRRSALVPAVPGRVHGSSL